MIKDNQKHFNRLHVVIDAIIIALAYVLSWSVQFQLLNRESGYVFRHYMTMLPFLIPLYLVLYAVFWPVHHQEREEKTGRSRKDRTGQRGRHCAVYDSHVLLPAGYEFYDELFPVCCWHGFS